MSIVIVVVCLGLAALAAVWERNVYNPATLFFAFWTFVSGLSALRLFNLYPVSDRAYWLLILGFVCFFVGFALVKVVKPLKRPRERTLDEVALSDRITFNYPVLIAAYCVLIAYLAFGAFQSVSMLIQGYDLHDVRLQYFLEGTTLATVLQIFFVDIIMYVSLSVSLANFFAGRHKKLMLLLTFAIIVLYAVQNGGRLIFYRFAVDVVVTCLVFMGINRSYQKAVQRMAPLFAGILVAAVVGIVAITALRSSSLKTFYVYFAGCINLFDNRLAAADLAGHQTYGYGLVAGIVKPFFFITDNLGILHYPESYMKAYGILRIHTQPYYHISPDILYNAYITPFLYFYLDFRIPGIILGSALYGAIASLAYKNMMRRPDIRSIAIYVLLAEELFTTMIRWQFTVQSYVLALLILLLGYGVFRRKRAAPAGGAPDDGVGGTEPPETKPSP